MIDSTADIRDCTFGIYTEVGARMALLEVGFGDYSYVVKVPNDIAARLKRLSWWGWDHDTLCKALPDFRVLPIQYFLDKYERLRTAA